ncbi:MAG: N-acyl homoserine lactonase family protein [Pseudomonadota bacterium]|nr:N-acyl homoserine lactonase family protein [Pseudomonadota bacterium]
MGVKLYAMTCGWLTMSLKAMLEGAEGSIRVPVPTYLVVHPKGKVLFDSGLNRQVQTDPEARLGGIAKYYGIDFHPGEDVAARLASLDVDVSQIDWVVNSHLHFDHAGGNDALTHSPLLLQRPEWEAAQDPDLAHKAGFMKQDYDHGHDVVLADGEHDIFGDGTVVCIPTYGHTPGHQSLKVRTASGDIVLTGDACYLRRTLEEMRLPRILHDAAQMRSSLEKLRELQRRGARIFYGHDPEFWAGVPQAPLAVA